jgi:hypothetical protein
MKTARKILNKKMNWDTGFPLNEPERMYIISSMEEYAEQMVYEYSNWLLEMDRLKLTNQLPPFETPEAMTEYFLKAKIRPLQECSQNSEHLLNIPCVSKSVCDCDQLDLAPIKQANGMCLRCGKPYAHTVC